MTPLRVLHLVGLRVGGAHNPLRSLAAALGDGGVLAERRPQLIVLGGDNLDVCRGYTGTLHWRNCQTIINSAYYGKLFWAGSSTSLEHQARGAARGAVGGNGEEDLMEERLRQMPEYVEMFEAAFGTHLPEVKDAWRAIAAYERTLVQTDTPFDNYMNGDAGALSAEAKRGKKVFEGKAGCIQCHDGALFSNERYYNLGVPDNPTFEDNAMRQITYRFEQYAKGVPEWVYRKAKTDLGLFYRSKVESDMGKFRVPSLRYTKYSGPYMHNGVFETLAEVVDFYDAGGGEDPIERNFGFTTKTALMQPLNLTDREKADLVAFIESLSGDPIIDPMPALPKYAPTPLEELTRR